MNESDLWRALKNTKPSHVRARRIETGATSSGVADVLYSRRMHSGWLELKIGVEQKNGDVALKKPLTAQQVEFLLDMEHAGCAAHVLIVTHEFHWFLCAVTDAALYAAPIKKVITREHAVRLLLMYHGTSPRLLGAALAIWDKLS